MIRKIAGLKFAVLGMFCVGLVSVACSDDDDDIFNGGAGTSSGGKAATAGGSSSGAATGGTNGGTASAGTTSAAGTGTGGATAGSAGKTSMGGGGAAAGADAGGASGAGGEGGMAVGGEGGALSGGEGGAGGEGGTPFVADVLDNPGFEVGTAHTVPTGWTNEGTDGAAYVEYAGAHDGFGKLSHYKDYVASTSYTARTYQTVAPIANGTYSFSLWLDRDWEDQQYLFARGYDANDPNAEMKLDTTDVTGYTKVTLSGIPVTSGTITVGIYTAAPTGSWANIDDAALTLE
jgi:hypothetical protein